MNRIRLMISAMAAVSVFRGKLVLVRKKNLLSLLLVAFGLQGGAFAQSKLDPELFPLPEELKPNVEFWKMVYGKYGNDQVLIHDAEDLSVIYEVVDFDDLFVNHEALSLKTKWKKIDKIKDRYRDALRALARKISRKAELTAEEQRLLSLFGENATPRRLRRASNQIRGQLGMSHRFLLGIKRSGLYMDEIKRIFKEHGLPEPLAYLPHVESSFHYRAYSKFGAAGLWQFTRGTGRRFMKINYTVDERIDPLISTEAAAKLLKHNYKVLQYWPLALTAYNHGLNGMRRAKRQFGNDIAKIVKHYKSRIFGFASRNFYAEFLAAYEVATNYKKYFGEVEFHEPAHYETFTTKKYYSVKAILDAFKLDLEEFREFNPALRPPVLRGQRRIPKGFTLRIPTRPGLDAKKLWASLKPEDAYSEQVLDDWYKVRRGDNLSRIARRYRISLDALMSFNEIDDPHKIFVGQILKIPQSNAVAAARKKTSSVFVADATAAPRPPKKRPDVKKNPKPRKPTPPALVELASGLSTPVDIIAPPGMTVELTGSDGARLVFVPTQEYGQHLEKPVRDVFVPQPPSEWITVEPDETLGHFAEWLNLPARTLRRLNGLAFGEEIQVGQKLRLSYDKVAPEEFQRRRYEYQQSIREDFFSTYYVESVVVHTVRRGQSLWYITNRLYDVPLWLVMQYNVGKNLQDLHIGDKITIPVVAEIPGIGYQPEP